MKVIFFTKITQVKAIGFLFSTKFSIKLFYIVDIVGNHFIDTLPYQFDSKVLTVMNLFLQPRHIPEF